MKVTSRAVVGRGGRLDVLDSAAPLTLRRVRCDEAGTCALCLVGTAAGPLAGDELTLCLEVAAGARAELRATGASIAQGRAGTPATLSTGVRLAPGAGLVADPGPLIVCDGSHVDVVLRLDVAAGARLEWHETVVLGRTDDSGTGTATVRWDVTREGRPVLRQFLDLADSVLRSWPGHVGAHRVLASALLTGPDIAARTVVAPPEPGVRFAAAQRVDERTVLVTVLADDVHVAARLRDRLVPQPAAGSVAACPR